MGKIVKITKQQLQIIREEETKESTKPLSIDEIGALELLHDFHTPNEAKPILHFLITMGGFQAGDAADLFFLFKNNYQENGDYTNISNPNRVGNTFVSKIREGDANDFTDEEIGPEFSMSSGSYTTPEIQFYHDELTLDMNFNQFDMDYSRARDNWTLRFALDGELGYGHENREDDDELNYIHYTIGDDNIRLIGQIATHLGDIDISTKISNNKNDLHTLFDDGELDNFLSENLPDRYYSSLVNSFLYDYGYANDLERAKYIHKVYKEEYPFEFETYNNGDVMITIPYSKLIPELVENPSIQSFSDFKDLPMFEDDIYLDDAWYEGADSADYTSLKSNFKSELEDIINAIDAGDLKSHAGSVKELQKIIKPLGFGPSPNMNVYATTNNGPIRVDILLGGLDFEKKLVEIKRYDNDTGEVTSHKVPFTELTNYVNQADIIKESILNKLRNFI